MTSIATDTDSGATITWSATGLPGGLSISSSTGTITGTPSTPGTYSVGLLASDNTGHAGSAAFTWTINSSVVVSAVANRASPTGDAVTLTPSATDTASGAILTWTASGLPAGLGINSSTGAVTGIPTTTGIYSVTLTATDDSGYSGSTSFSWSITNGVTVAAPGDQSTVTGSAIAPLASSATDTDTNATFTWSATGLPTGLSISSSTGTITGTPTTPGSYTVALTATDNSSFSGSTTFTWATYNTVSVSGPSSKSTATGSAITTVSPTGTDTQSSATLTWTADSLPSGLSINATTGAITGVPTDAGSTLVTVTATDGAGYSASFTIAWTTTNIVTVVNPGAMTKVSGLAVLPTIIGATDSSINATLTYSSGSTLPAGITIDPDSGTLMGAATTAGVYSVVITVTDSAGYTGTTSFTWTITNVVTITLPAAPTSVTGTAIASFAPSATDSSSTATITSWSVVNLPAGLSMNTTTGIVTGTPTTGGTYFGVQLTATDSAGFTRSASFVWTITNTVTVASIANQSASTNHAVISVIATATDTQISPAVTFAWTATGLPAGIVMDRTTGTMSGTPTLAGVYSVVATAGDSATPKFSGIKSFTWTVTNVVPAITAVAPATGPGGGGTVVKITGTDLQATSAVRFGTTPGTSISVNGTGTLVTVTSPAHVVGTVDITLTALGGTSPVVTADQYVYTGPTITSLGTTSGPTSGATSVKINGTSMTGATSVLFGTTPATSFTVASSGLYVTAVAPAHAAGTVDITVITPGGTSAPVAADRYTYVTPVVTSISPNSGTITGGTVIKVNGAMLGTVTSVKFGTTAATTFSVNAAGTIITATAPAHSAGLVDVTVVSPSGTTATSTADQYTYIAPAITSLSVASGTRLGGTSIKINGVNLGGATAIKFGTTPATTFTVNAAGTIVTVTTPPHATGAVDVTVTTPAGTTALVAADRYTFT